MGTDYGFYSPYKRTLVINDARCPVIIEHAYSSLRALISLVGITSARLLNKSGSRGRLRLKQPSYPQSMRPMTNSWVAFNAGTPSFFYYA